MRTSRILATVVALLLVGHSGFLAKGQQPQQPPRQQPPAGQGQPPQGQPPQGQPQRGGTPTYPHGIAVVDITYILDNYQKLKQIGVSFKKEVEDAQTKFKGEGEAIGRGAEQLKGMKTGTKEFKDLEEKLAKQQSDLKVNASLKEKEFAEREAKIYYQAYQDASKFIDNYAERNGISLVIRFNGTPVNQNDQQAVRADMLKMVQYYDERIDITPMILEQLNKSAAAPATARPPAGQPGQPPQNKAR